MYKTLSSFTASLTATRGFFFSFGAVYNNNNKSEFVTPSQMFSLNGTVVLFTVLQKRWRYEQGSRKAFLYEVQFFFFLLSMQWPEIISKACTM